MPVTAPPIPRLRSRTSPSPIQVRALPQVSPRQPEALPVNRKERTEKSKSGQWNGAFLDELEEHLVRQTGTRTSTILQNLNLDQVPSAGLISDQKSAVEKLAETSHVSVILLKIDLIDLNRRDRIEDT
jgi:hypothetical protein